MLIPANTLTSSSCLRQFAEQSIAQHNATLSNLNNLNKPANNLLPTFTIEPSGLDTKDFLQIINNYHKELDKVYSSDLKVINFKKIESIFQQVTRLTKQVYSYEFGKQLFKQIEENNQLTKSCQQLREKAMRIEESMEKAMLNFLLQTVSNSQAASNTQQEFLNNFNKLCSAQNNKQSKADIKLIKLKKLQTLLHDYPNKYATKKHNVLPFKFVERYIKMVNQELFLLKNSQQSIFNIENSNHQITFVGAGSLPLTAIILAIQTGLTVNMVEIDEEVAKNLTKFINLIEYLNIVDNNQLNIICGDGANFNYAPADDIGANQQNTIACQYLIVASAVPASAFNKITHNISPNTLLAKRYVPEHSLSAFYYEPPILPGKPFKLLGQCVMPQNILAQSKNALIKLTNLSNSSQKIVLGSPEIANHYAIYCKAAS